MKLETVIDEARVHLHRAFLLSKEENREELFRELLIGLHVAIRQNKFQVEKLRPTSEQRRQFIHKLDGMEFFELAGCKGASYIITNGKFLCPDGTLKKSPSGAIEYQLNQNIRPGTRGRTFSGWWARNAEGDSAEECLLKHIIK